MTNKPADFSKRIFAALIDLIIIVLVISCLTILLNGTAIVEKYETLANNANDIYNSYAISMNIGTLVNVSGVNSLSLNSNVTSEDLSHFNSMLGENTTFMSSYNNAMNYRLIYNICVIGVVELVYLFLIPFFSKRGQTVGKMLLGLGVVDIRYDMYLDKKNKAIRFAIGFLVETCLLLLFFKESGSTMVLLFSPLLVLTSIMFSQSKQALHDVVAHAKVVDLRTATIFNSPEEKEKYDASLLNKENKEDVSNENREDIIEAEVKEIIETEEDKDNSGNN